MITERPVQQQPQLLNVEEDFDIYDSMVVYWDLAQLSSVPQGWFSNFQQLSATNRIAFFDMRNKANTDLAFNNQDTRDMSAFAMEIESIGVAFWGPGNENLFHIGTGANFCENTMAAFWKNDLNRHCSLTLRIQNDERLKIASLMTPPGSGPVGGGYGQLALKSLPDMSANPAIGAFTAGVPKLPNQWQFPDALAVPRRASLGVSIEINEYARTMLGRMPAQAPLYATQEWEEGQAKPTMPFGITVHMSGKRFVQQRGALHA